MKHPSAIALSALTFAAAAAPAVLYVQPAASALRSAIAIAAVAVVATVLFVLIARSHSATAAFATALAFAVLTPLASEHAPWSASAGSDVYAVQRDVNTLMPAVLVGGIGVLLRPRRRRVARAVALLAGAGIIATILGAPGDLRLLALPFWWHVPDGVRTIRRLITAVRLESAGRIVGSATMMVALGYLWSPALQWLSGVGILLAPLLADGSPAG